MLNFTGITVRLGGRTILDRATAALPPGSHVGLIGHNGAGKSTLMKIVARMNEPDEGGVEGGGVVEGPDAEGDAALGEVDGAVGVADEGDDVAGSDTPGEECVDGEAAELAGGTGHEDGGHGEGLSRGRDERVTPGQRAAPRHTSSGAVPTFW